jgi:hypothetical protein
LQNALHHRLGCFPSEATTRQHGELELTLKYGIYCLSQFVGPNQSQDVGHEMDVVEERILQAE